MALQQERLGENVKWKQPAVKLCVRSVKNTGPYGPETDGRVLKGESQSSCMLGLGDFFAMVV